MEEYNYFKLNKLDENSFQLTLFNEWNKSTLLKNINALENLRYLKMQL